MLGVVLTLSLAACQTASDSALPTPQTRVQFRCANGEDVEMRFFPEQGVAVLVRAGETLELQQQPSASGFIYGGGPVTVRGKGSELRIEVGRMVPILCQARDGDWQCRARRARIARDGTLLSDP